VRTVFFGSGAFGVPVLDALASDPSLRLVGVVSVPDRPAGRGHRLTPPPVVDPARERGLDVLQPRSLRAAETVAAIRDLDPDLAVLADYGRIVPLEVLAIPRRGFLNLHPSLLPRHRGATPIQATILAGDAEAGVSLFEMDAGLDTGPVVAQVAWPLAADVTAPALEAEAARRAAALVGQSLRPWLAGDLRARPQSERGVTLTRPLAREDGRLDATRPAAELERRVRALQPWPGTFLETAAGRVAVLDAAVLPSESGDEPGTVVASGRGVALATSDGRLQLRVVTPAGSRPMTGEDLVRGRPGLVGSRVIAPG
jgi:methionyl-tRNA formyltransferase